jgi:hypothetical protein
MLCPSLAHAECPIDPRACTEACQLQPDTEETP